MTATTSAGDGRRLNLKFMAAILIEREPLHIGQHPLIFVGAPPQNCRHPDLLAPRGRTKEGIIPALSELIWRITCASADPARARKSQSKALSSRPD